MHFKHRPQARVVLAIAVEALALVAIIVAMTYLVPLVHALMQLQPQ